MYLKNTLSNKIKYSKNTCQTSFYLLITRFILNYQSQKHPI